MEGMDAVDRRVVAALRRRFRGLRVALGHVPDRQSWAQSAGLALGMTAIAVPLALAGGLVSAPMEASAGAFRTLVIPFLAPALVEECVFRGLLLPYPRTPGSTLAERAPWWAGSLLLYVALHPLAAALVRPAARGVFDSPAFLLEAALLGITATVLYERTASLWPAVLLHGTVVAVWLNLGGARLLGL